jgi:hypothetical protein
MTKVKKDLVSSVGVTSKCCEKQNQKKIKMILEFK